MVSKQNILCFFYTPARLLKFGALALCCRGTKSAGGGGGSICRQHISHQMLNVNNSLWRTILYVAKLFAFDVKVIISLGGGGMTTHGLPPAPASAPSWRILPVASVTASGPGLTEASLAWPEAAGGSGRLTSICSEFLAGPVSGLWNGLLISTWIGFLSWTGLDLLLLSPSLPWLVFSVIL